MADIFKNIAQLPGNLLQGAGGILQGAAQGISGIDKLLRAPMYSRLESAEQQRQLQELRTLIQAAPTPQAQATIARKWMEQHKPEVAKMISEKDWQPQTMDWQKFTQGDDQFRSTMKVGPGGTFQGATLEPPEEYQPGIVENTKTGEQRPYTWGEPIPSGFKIVREAQTVVNVGQELKPPSPTERTDIAKGRASIDALDNLKSLFDKSYVGVARGRWGKVLDVFGGNPQAQSAFYAATSAFKNAIIKEITGAQMSEVEAKRIMKQVPDINDPPSVWEAKWSQSKKNLEFLQKRRLEILRQSGLIVPGETPTTMPQERPRMPQGRQTLPGTSQRPNPPPKDLEKTIGKEKADMEMQGWMMIYDAWDTLSRQLQDVIKQRLKMGSPYMEIVSFDEVSEALDRYRSK